MGTPVRSPSLHSAAGVLLLALGCDRPASDGERSAERGPRPAHAVIERARAGTVRTEWRFSGEVRARARAQLAAGAAGEVERLTVEVGDRVRQGALLLEVDRDLAAARLGLARARVAEAQEALAQAERELARLKGLSAGVVPELEREQARSRVDAARAATDARRAEAREARAQLDLHRIRAPFDGVISDRRVDRGDWVSPGDPALELVSDEDVDVLVDAAADLLSRVRPGTEARMLRPVELPLEVAGLVPALEPGTRTLRVRLVPTARHPAVIPGAAVEVAFAVELAAEDAVVVAEDAVLFDGDRYRVVTVVDGLARPVEVEVVARAGGEVLVRAAGLDAGTEVLTRGNERVRPGQKVVASESTEGARAETP